MIRITAATGSRPQTTHQDGIERVPAYYREPQQEYWESEEVWAKLLPVNGG